MTERHLAEIQRELMLVSRHQTMATLQGVGADGGTLERSAYVLLNRLEAEGPMSIGQLAEAFRLDTSTVNRQTAAMLRATLVERIPDPDGGIARKLAVTEEGVRRLAADRAVYREGLLQVLQGWTQPEVDRLLAALTHFNSSVERLEARPWPRPELPAG